MSHVNTHVGRMCRDGPLLFWTGGGGCGQFSGACIFELFFVKKIPLSRHMGYVKGGWVSGSVDQWISGSVDQWISGSVRDVCMSHQSDWIYF